MYNNKNGYIDLNDNELNQLLDDFFNYFDDGFVFEQFLRGYLETIGIDELEVTQRYRDGGIDLKGIRKGLDLLTDLDSVNYYIQAKLYNPSSTVSIRDVRALRGVMPNGYKGIFITTGRFSKKALEFGRNDSSRPIIFIDGKKLIQSCIDNNIGFKSKPVFDSKILDDMLEEEKIVEKEINEKSKKDMKNTIKKKISINDVRARILPIPKTILEKIPGELKSYEVLFEDKDKKNMNINRQRKYFGGITAIYKKYNFIRKDGKINSKDSYWLFDKENQLIKVYFEKEK